MKYLPYIIIGLVIITFLYYFGVFEAQKPLVGVDRSTDIAIKQWETKTDEQANVTVTVTPTDLVPDSKEWKFDIVMDTHSVELDQDLIKSAVLIDNQGKEYKPIAWEGPVGGHHREGVLVFSAVEPTPQAVELKISGLGDVVRSFAWQLK